MIYKEPVEVESTGKHPCVEWNNKRWYLTQNYYVDRTGKLLHRAIYESVHGEIPQGYHIHHKNEIKSDNRIENLEALTVSEHIKSHEPRGATHPDYDRAIGAKAMWEQRKPKKHFCAECGSEFESTCTRARFCKTSCSGKYNYYKKLGKR